MRYGHPPPEAPTHLGPHQPPLPPEWLPAGDFADDEDDPPTHARAWSTALDISDSASTRQAPPPRGALELPHPADVRREAARRIARNDNGYRAYARTYAASTSMTGEVVTSARDPREPARGHARDGRPALEVVPAVTRARTERTEAPIGLGRDAERRRPSGDDRRDAKRDDRRSRGDDRRSRGDDRRDASDDDRRARRDGRRDASDDDRRSRRDGRRGAGDDDRRSRRDARQGSSGNGLARDDHRDARSDDLARDVHRDARSDDRARHDGRDSRGDGRHGSSGNDLARHDRRDARGDDLARHDRCDSRGDRRHGSSGNDLARADHRDARSDDLARHDRRDARGDVRHGSSGDDLARNDRQSRGDRTSAPEIRDPRDDLARNGRRGASGAAAARHDRHDSSGDDLARNDRQSRGDRTSAPDVRDPRDDDRHASADRTPAPDVRESSRRSSSSSSSAVDDERPSARGSQPQLDLAKQLLQQQQQAAAMAAIGAIDPLQVPVPPELGGPIYSWVRRLALQADLTGADKVLRDAFLDLTSSLSVAIVYPGADGLWTLGADDEIPKDASPLVAVAQARRAVVSSHTALVPIVTSSETVAVVVLTRNPRNPAYHPVEQVAMVALARESAAILHHLAIAHLQHANEIKADQGGLYRGEALEAHRKRGNEGVPVNLSPGWVKRTYPILIVTILVAAFAAVFITVPTYSSGSGVVVLKGTTVSAPTAGTVEEVLVKPGQQVVKGTLLVRLHSAEQDAELRQAQTDADNATIQYLFDPQDEQVKKTLATALARVDREEARVESRLVRARTAGTVSDVRVRVGMLLQPGSQVLQIVDPNAEPEVWAFLPGKDRPRLREGQDLQVGLAGYTKTREKARIYHVTPEALGPMEAAKIVGEGLADSIKLAPGSYVWVKAKLPGKTFKTQHRTFWYHHGMPAKTEVKIQSKPFLVTLLPALEKYIPD